MILGISAFYHDSAAALVRDGRVVAAAQEERFSRKKNDAGFPGRAIASCLEVAGMGEGEIDAVVFHEKPVRKFARVLETFMATVPWGLGGFVRMVPGWLREKLDVPTAVRRNLAGLRRECPVLFAGHHQSHGASAWLASGMRTAAVLTVDGVGEWATAMVARGADGVLTPLLEMRFPHSPGLLYSAFTGYCGFRVNSGEYKLMGLAPYGEARYAGMILERVMKLHEDGSFHLVPEAFGFLSGERMTSEAFHGWFGGPPRREGEAIEQRHADIARSVQEVTEEMMLRMARTVRERTGERALCLAGGVALNCVANGRLLRESGFERIWVQPAAGDAGAALGAALTVASERGEVELGGGGDLMGGAMLGPAFGDEEIRRVLERVGAVYEVVEAGELARRVAEWLAGGRAAGWFQGRMEFGPRALGGRSILADPRDPGMQRRLNVQIKFRESFRPFAPVVLAEKVHEWFEVPEGFESPYMLFTAGVRRERLVEPGAGLRGLGLAGVARSEIPAVTHVDGSARLQTVDRGRQPLLHEVLRHFDGLTGCPVLVNTSFNVRGEPVVATPEDAWRCFCGTNLPLLVMGNCWVERGRQREEVCPREALPRLCQDD